MRRARTWNRSTSDGGTSGCGSLLSCLLMTKRCSNCRKEYWARWRNEPVELCPECRIGAIVCEKCGELVRGLTDPHQLHLFPDYTPRLPSRVEKPTLEERYWSLRAKASQATRRRYPFC